MKITVERALFLKALMHVHRVVERRNTIPVLSNVLLEADGATLRMCATDLDIKMSETIACDVAQPGATTLPAHTLHEIVRKLPDGALVSLDATSKDGPLTLKSGRSRFTLQCLPAADFPDIAAGDMPTRFSMPASHLKTLIEKTQFAMASDETRYYLNGIFLHPTEDDGQSVLRAVATDGHRLARVQVPGPAGIAGMSPSIFPRKAVIETLKLLEDDNAEVQIELSSAKIRLTIGPVILTSKLIDGTFPDYARVIPRDNHKRLIVSRDEFRRTVDRVSTISTERGRALALYLSTDHIAFSVTSPDHGTAKEQLDAEYDAEPLDVGFNARYLIDIADNIDGDDLLILFNDAGSPAIIQDRANTFALYILMPLRL